MATNARSYVLDLPGGTATTSLQFQAKRTLKFLVLSVVCAAVGEIEVSSSPSSQIGTAQPSDEVVARFRIAAAGRIDIVMPFAFAVSPFQNLYIHQTGAGNVGCASMF